jgi:hypothetical protein
VVKLAKRYDPDKRKDAKVFSKTADAVHKKNYARPMRGGIRL